MSETPLEQSTSPDIPERGRLLGIDYGTRRIGVAVTDVFQEISSPLHNYECRSDVADAQFFRKLCDEYEVAGLIFGLPVHMSGDESQKSREARQFAVWLGKVVGRPVDFHDERFSSVQAESLMLQADLNARQRKSRIDKLAAQIILQGWIQRRETEKSPPESQTDAIDEDRQESDPDGE